MALILSRQALPVLDLGDPADLRLRVRAGGYVVPGGLPRRGQDVILIATGSELHLALERAARLAGESFARRRGQHAKLESLRPTAAAISRERAAAGRAGVGDRGRLAVGLAIVRRTASRMRLASSDLARRPPGEVVMREYGFTVENVCAHARRLSQARSRKIRRGKNAAGDGEIRNLCAVRGVYLSSQTRKDGV